MHELYRYSIQKKKLRTELGDNSQQTSHVHAHVPTTCDDQRGIAPVTLPVHSYSARTCQELIDQCELRLSLTGGPNERVTSVVRTRKKAFARSLFSATYNESALL